MRRRVLAAIVTSFLVVSAAAACGSSDSSAKTAGSTTSPSASAASTIDAVKVTGDPGKKPTVEFKKPFSVAATASKVLKQGSGAKISEGQEVVVDYVGINGRDSKEFDSSWQRGEPATFGLQQGKLINGFLTGLVGKTVGSRILVTIPPKDGYGDQGQPQAGIQGTDTLVFVIDVKDAYKPLAQAEGDTVTPPKGLPTVKTDAKGVPTAITIPKGASAPKELVAQPLIKGKGEKVDAKATINFHYLAANWRTGKEFDSSWKRGSYENLPLGQTAVKGLTEGLTGQTVGSRVLLVLPPDKSFGQDLQGTDLKKTDTVVFVVDILGAK
ncbi:FKBP-type peptidyl-prolyl cis-trans isomerase [Actinopolymorpha alba]|uniref:FKBP-type peptidyl-prolyl cis-trans isomerase n=1 Tax=Actinopolymorpha alba TaxID=533267 RepID=UPI00039A156F|nr:FKBP-type peptidyl-prolyl cis-trans isomerase [Actinopolymorpha alba]